MRIIFIAFIILFSNLSQGQVHLLNAKKPADFEKKSKNIEKPLAFLSNDSIIEENDVLWSKVVYESIDLNEKLNFPLLFPIEDDVDKIGRKSLWRILKEYIIDELSKDSLSSNFEIYSNDNFSQKEKLTNNEILDQISFEVPNQRLGTLDREYILSKHIGEYRIKGIWYFSKRAGELKYRLLGIQPVAASLNDIKNETPNPKLESTVFWIWYPSIRDELHNHLVFNQRNNNNNITFDDLLVNRRFNSYIYKYDNVYGDRKIKDYILQRDGESDESYRIRFILESERIKKEILDFENDMWGY